MAHLSDKKTFKNEEKDTDDEELSENEEKNLENILSIFPYREKINKDDQVDNKTFDKVKSILTCPICLELCRDPAYVKDCMHRFCRGCIEKIIRGPNKTCPSCRKPIGSKRELRFDNSTVSMMKAIFKDINKYIQLQEKEEELYVQEYNKKKKSDVNKQRKTKSLGGKSNSFSKNNTTVSTGIAAVTIGVITSSSSLISSSTNNLQHTTSNNTLNDNDEYMQLESHSIKNKKRKLNQKILDMEEDAVQETKTINPNPEADNTTTLTTNNTENNTTSITHNQNEVENTNNNHHNNNKQKLSEILSKNKDDLFSSMDDNMRENLKFMLSVPNFENYLKDLDFCLAIKIEPYPHDIMPRLEENIFRTCSAIQLKQICKLICRNIRLNENKYSEKIILWININDKFEQLTGNEITLSELNNTYWKDYNDPLWDIDSFIDEIICQSYKKLETNRVLYYSLNWEDYI